MTADWLAAALIALALPLLLWRFYVGFQASDDMQYVDGALGWLDHAPYVGRSHWTLRHTITLPTALSIAVFGLGRVSVGLSNVVYFGAFLAVNVWGIRRSFGPTVATIALAIFLTLPGFLVVATYLNPDIPEVCLVSAAFWVLLWARERPVGWGRWVVAGALAGAAFVNRQTAAALVLFVFGLWVLRPGTARRRYLPMACAFLAVVVCDWLYLTALTGDPAYRYNIDLHHDPVDRWAEAARVAASGAWIDKEGNLSVHVLIDPLLNLFVTQKYTVVFWLLLPALGGLFGPGRQGDPRALPEAGRLLFWLGATSFLFVAANPKLYLVPRYFAPAAWAEGVLGAWWLGGLWSGGRTRLAATCLTLVLLVDAVALGVENTDPRWPERQLVEWVRRHPGQTVHTDVETRARADYFFRFAGIDSGSVSTEAPPAGAAFFFVAERVRQCAAAPRCRDRVADFEPRGSWRATQVLDGPKRPAAGWLEALGLHRLVPTGLWQRIAAPLSAVTVFQVER